ncbi:metalloprotease [Coemansia sp. BCRC 34301]|nr:metalloprotease [Coemansia sp. BCRC 34301]
MVGNTNTLKQGAKDHSLDLYKELLKFYNQYYSSDIMKLVVCGNYSLDQLVEWAVSKFSSIKSNGDNVQWVVEHPLTAEYLGKAIYYETINDTNNINITFPVPNVKALNEFMPNNLAVKNASMLGAAAVLRPTLLKLNDSFELWFKQDDQFATFKGNIFLSIDVPTANCLPEDNIANIMYCRLLTIKLEEELYNAKFAGLAFQVSTNDSSIEISVSGFASKLPELLITILERAKAFKVDDAVLSTYITVYKRAFNSIANSKPARHCSINMEYINISPLWHYKLLESAVGKTTPAKLKEYVDSLCNATFVKMCMVGNFDEDDALNTAERVQSIIKPTARLVHSWGDSRAFNIEPGYYVYQAQVPNTDSQELLGFWNKYINPNTAPAYTRIDVQMWSTKIWKPTAGNFKTYSAKTLALFGCLASEGNSQLDISKVDEFISTSIAAIGDSADSMVEKLKSACLSESGAVYTAGESAERATHTITALELAINDHKTFGNYSEVCQTNFATIGMSRTPDGIWLIEDYRKFQATQQLHGRGVFGEILVPKYTS